MLQNVLVSTGDTVTVQQFQLPRASFEIALLTAEVRSRCSMLPLADASRGAPVCCCPLQDSLTRSVAHTCPTDRLLLLPADQLCVHVISRQAGRRQGV